MESKQLFSRRCGDPGPMSWPFEGSAGPSPVPIRGYDAETIRPREGLAVPVTALVNYSYCPRYGYLRYVKRARTPLTREGVRAFFNHELFKRMLVNEFSVVSQFRSNMTAGEMAQLYHEEFYDVIGEMRGCVFGRLFGEMGLSWSQELQRLDRLLLEASLVWAEKLLRVADATGLEAFELARFLIPRRRAEVFYEASEIGVSGARVDVVEDGFPVEVKAGRAPVTGICEAHVLQLVWYSLVMEYAEGRDVDVAEVYYVNGFQRRRFGTDQGLRRWALGVRNMAFEAFQAERAPERGRCNRPCLLERECRQSL